MTELIVLCDESGRPTGTAEKLPAHNAHTPLHRAFSCYVFDRKGRILVTQRAASKKVWPTVWTNSCCGHPAPKETDEAAIARRLEYELGLAAEEPVCLVPDYRYTTPPYRGIIENEYCPIYAVRTDYQPKPNPDEVDDYHWLAWEEYVARLADDQKDVYSWWCKDQLSHLVDNQLLVPFTQPVQ